VHRDESDGRACVFCEIARRDPEGQKLYSDPDAFVIEPLNPVVPGHRLVIPYLHVADALENPYVTADVIRTACKYADFSGRRSWNIITSVGSAATQTVFHLHIHLVPRTEGDGLHLPWTGQHD
jgi:histidine triad (HIT) family protein